MGCRRFWRASTRRAGRPETPGPTLVQSTGLVLFASRLLDGVGLGVGLLFNGVGLFVQRLFHRLIVSFASLLFQSVSAGFTGVFDGVSLIFGGRVGGAFAGGERAGEGEDGGGGECLTDEHVRFLLSRHSGGHKRNAPVIGRFTRM